MLRGNRLCPVCHRYELRDLGEQCAVCGWWFIAEDYEDKDNITSPNRFSINRGQKMVENGEIMLNDKVELGKYDFINEYGIICRREPKKLPPLELRTCD